MTRWFVVLWLVIGMAIGAGSALAAEGHDHGGAADATQTVTGEVVDLACYLGHGAQGAGHQGCAQKCINSGLPVGIKSGDTLYLAVGSEHGTANAALGPLASKQVTVEGVVTERDGVHLIAVKTVTAS
jgi:hypothetical protein